MLYDWPVHRVNRTHPRLGTLGEFRGLAQNDITRVHSGTDIAIAGGNVNVWSPDTGLVRRHTPAANGNPSGGGGPIRVGHFSFNHITTINVRPGRRYNGVLMPANLPIYVVEANSFAYVPRPGVANPNKDAHFRRGRVPNNMPVVAYRRIAADNYQQSTLWPRSLAIGVGVNPTDLHCIYYTTADGPYADGGNVANCLEVFRNYRNRVLPEATALKLYTQNANQLFLDLGVAGGTRIHRPAMGGLDFKLWAQSLFNSRCGVYQIEYEIKMHLGNTTGRLNAWKFHQPPPDNQAFDLVDPRLSNFATVNNKRTVYNITNSRNAVINPAYHWEVENPAQWPDGCYGIKVWVKNIRESVGVGRDPRTNERLYGAEWNVETLANNNRRIKVTKTFKSRARNWEPAYAECKKRGKGKKLPPKKESKLKEAKEMKKTEMIKKAAKPTSSAKSKRSLEKEYMFDATPLLITPPQNLYHGPVLEGTLIGSWKVKPTSLTELSVTSLKADLHLHDLIVSQTDKGEPLLFGEEPISLKLSKFKLTQSQAKAFGAINSGRYDRKERLVTTSVGFSANHPAIGKMRGIFQTVGVLDNNNVLISGGTAIILSGVLSGTILCCCSPRPPKPPVGGTPSTPTPTPTPTCDGRVVVRDSGRTHNRRAHTDFHKYQLPDGSFVTLQPTGPTPANELGFAQGSYSAPAPYVIPREHGRFKKIEIEVTADAPCRIISVTRTMQALNGHFGQTFTTPQPVQSDNVKPHSIAIRGPQRWVITDGPGILTADPRNKTFHKRYTVTATIQVGNQPPFTRTASYTVLIRTNAAGDIDPQPTPP